MNRLTALLACVALLFCRVALATFACPAEMLTAPAMQMADCDEHAPAANPPLCQKSCNDDPQKAEDASAAMVPPAAISASYLLEPAPIITTGYTPVADLARANAPPLLILLGRLRN